MIDLILLSFIFLKVFVILLKVKVLLIIEKVVLYNLLVKLYLNFQKCLVMKLNIMHHLVLLQVYVNQVFKIIVFRFFCKIKVNKNK